MTVFVLVDLLECHIIRITVGVPVVLFVPDLLALLMCWYVCCRKAEQCKASGNTCYMSKDYAAAVRLYTEAIGEFLAISCLSPLLELEIESELDMWKYLLNANLKNDGLVNVCSCVSAVENKTDRQSDLELFSVILKHVHVYFLRLKVMSTDSGTRICFQSSFEQFGQ